MMKSLSPRPVAIAAAIVLTAIQLVYVFTVDEPVPALVLAVLFAVGAFLVGRGGRWTALIIAVPALFDLMGSLTFFRPAESSAQAVGLVFLGLFSGVALLTSVLIAARPRSDVARTA